MTRRLVSLLPALMAVALAGCGVPTEGGADLATPDEVPFGLLDEEREAVTELRPSAGSAVDVYLYDPAGDRLAPIRIQIERSTLESVLGALLDDLPEEADALGLRSAVAGTEVSIEAAVDGGVAVIDLSDEFTDLSGTDQLIAIAQLVYTSTGRPGVGQVSFTLAGENIEIPRGDGSLTSGSVTRDDYADFVPV